MATKQTNTQKWEAAWTRYVQALDRVQERRANGQRVDRARYGLRIAKANLLDTCKALNIEPPSCV